MTPGLLHPSGLRIKSAMTGTTRRFRIRPRMTGRERLVLTCSPSPLIPLPSRERGIGGCAVIYVWSWPSHGFVVLSGSVQSMKFGYVHRREYGACWFFVFIQLPLFPPRAPGFATTWSK